jgi:hypothetical protein
MKIVRTLLYLLLIVVVLYIVLCFTGPKKFELERSVQINASPDVVMAEVSDFRRWDAWSTWSKMDPEMENTYSGEAGMVGHSNTWKSAKVGNGTQTIVAISPLNMATELIFTDWDGISKTEFRLQPDGAVTTVTWTMDGSPIAFPVRGLMVILGMQKSLEKDYESGLAGLKKTIEG